MNVLSVCETARGGVGIYQNYLGSIEEPGLRFHFLAPGQHREFLDDHLSVAVFDRPGRGLRAHGNLLRQFLKLRRDIRPDIYFFHSSFALLPLLVLRLMRDRTPTLYCAHGWAVGTIQSGAARHRLVAMIERRLCRLADRVVNVSQNEQALAQRHDYHNRMILIENGVPDRIEITDQTAPLPPPKTADTTDLLFVGRFDRQKGLDLLLPAFEEARRNRPDLRLHLIGGPVRGSAEALSIPEHVNHVGWVDSAHLDAWFSFADAVVVPSRWEGLPLVIPEALRNGTPVLCAETSGMERLIERGRTGDHFPLTEPDMAKTLSGLDRRKLDAMRPECRRLYESRYSLDRWQKDITGLIAGLAEEEPRS